MNARIDAAYARQSVDKKDSISIESQLEFCRYELKGGTFKSYTDKGYSGKNTTRPAFQELLADIRFGLVKRVVVYKLDRISRSIIDFANLMELFQENQVEFVSSTEKFDTSTPMGRAMLNICIVFAQLERETIQKRVTDSYYSRCVKGYKMGGSIPYGFDTETISMDGIQTKQLVESPLIENVKLSFDMYKRPEVSLGDIARHLAKSNIQMGSGSSQRVTLSRMLRSPVYVKADMDIYNFYKSQGVNIVNEPGDFTGTNACYIYRAKDTKPAKWDDLQDHILVLAPHKGVIDSDVWLSVRRKIMNNKSSCSAKKATNTYLAGKAKCGNCGYALMNTTRSNTYRYLRCNKRAVDKSCAGPGKLLTSWVEDSVHSAMREKLAEFSTIRANGKNQEANPKLSAKKLELASLEAEIEKMLDKLLGANDILLSYANEKIKELDARRQDLGKEIAELQVNDIQPVEILKLLNYLGNWEDIAIEEKRMVIDALIERINVTSDNMDIVWKI